MSNDLYSWQKQCLLSWEQNDYHGIVNAVTGAGKTQLALSGLLHLQNSSEKKLHVKIIVPGKSLLLQWKSALIKILPPDFSQKIGLCGCGYNTTIEKDYMIYVINSARYRLARQILHELSQGDTVLLIADECHNYASRENRKIFEFLPYLPKLPGKYCSFGLSATTSVNGWETVLIPALGKEIYHYSLAEALKKDTVCDFAIWQIAIHFQKEEQQEYEQLSETMRNIRQKLFTLIPGLKLYEKTSFFAHLKEIASQKNEKTAKLARSYLQLAFKRKRTVHMASARITCAYQLIKKLGLQKQILIFGESIAQIEQLYPLLNHAYPSKIGRYHSKMGNVANKNTLDRFRSGNLRILLTCRALDEGINLPEASIGIILSGTSMERQRIQRLGRILRKHADKRMASLYYLFVADSQEEQAYFPYKKESFQAYNLWYDDTSNEFYFPDYERTASLILSDVTFSSLPANVQKEILHCLDEGYLRADWLLSSDECHQNALHCKDVHHQNYWLCMEKLAALRI